VVGVKITSFLPYLLSGGLRSLPSTCACRPARPKASRFPVSEFIDGYLVGLFGLGMCLSLPLRKKRRNTAMPRMGFEATIAEPEVGDLTCRRSFGQHSWHRVVSEKGNV
jgi:hypothetical protein